MTAFKEVLAILPHFGRDTTHIEVALQKVKIKAILETESPVNVLFSKLMKKLKITVMIHMEEFYK
ncbi:hypothetical protein DSO57_1001825 [Entomophthora muscae]|uniref:Uncharacterized protein n=1 Tax=Entomophthora muscae TaxID=34485 RepID=A0ACC2U778_9FUNG|nr:hypothetical protein DSO57_1001825 [Entomophthora muscae]